MEVQEDLVLVPSPKRVQSFHGFQLRPDDIALLDMLPEEQRAVLLLDGTYQERAEKLGIAVGTVRSRLHRARAALTSLRTPAADPSAPPN